MALFCKVIYMELCETIQTEQSAEYHFESGEAIKIDINDVDNRVIVHFIPAETCQTDTFLQGYCSRTILPNEDMAQTLADLNLVIILGIDLAMSDTIRGMQFELIELLQQNGLSTRINDKKSGINIAMTYSEGKDKYEN